MLYYIPTLTTVYNKRLFFNVSIVESRYDSKKCFRKGISCYGEKIGEASVVLGSPYSGHLNYLDLGMLYMSICSNNSLHLDPNSEEVKRKIFLACVDLAEALGKE